MSLLPAGGGRNDCRVNVTRLGSMMLWVTGSIIGVAPSSPHGSGVAGALFIVHVIFMAVVSAVFTVGPVYPFFGMSGQLPHAGFLLPAQIHRALYVPLRPSPSDDVSLIQVGKISQSVVPAELENPAGHTDCEPVT